MGDLIFLLRGHLRQSLAQRRVIEDRIVSESAGASRSPQQLAVDLATGLNDLPVRRHQGNDADELGLPLAVRHIFRVFQQKL